MPDELELVADCSQCFGLCCVLVPFTASSGFGTDKEGGVPCHHLQGDDGCEIHASLREDGWAGCAAFDCFGAGQHVAQGTYAGTSWRTHDNLGEMAAVLSVMRQLHEMVAHLTEAVRRTPDAAASDLLADVTRRTSGTPEDLLTTDLDELRQEVGPVLVAVSERLRAPHRVREELRGQDLSGHDLRDLDLRGADLRSALLIRADLRDTDLTDADVLGTDLRDADVRGADLSDALFLSQAQVNAARGDATTTVTAPRTRPGHWD